MNYNTLKTSVAAVIKENGNNEITGDILQQTLIAMINSLGVGYQFMGVAQPSTNPGAPDQRVFYIAAEPGTYTGFNTEVVPGEIAIFKFSNTWLKDSIFAFDLANVGFKGVFESGIGLDPSDGEPIVDVNYDASDYIPVGPGCVIVYSGGETDSNRAAIIGYDEDKYMVSVLLAGGSDWKNKIVAITDPDIKYVRVSSCNANHENYNTPFAFNVVATTDVLVKVQELIEDVELLSERIQQIDPVINVIRNGYTFKGIALPNETLTEDVIPTFYWVETPGTYPGGVLAANEVGLLIWNGADWTIEKLNLAKATALATTNEALTVLAGIVTDVLSVVGAGYEYMGVVMPNSVFPADTYKYKVAFLAQTPGTYTNHGAFAIADNEVALLMYDPASEEWSKQTLDVAKLSYSEETYAKQNGEYPEMKVGQAEVAENVASAMEDSPMFTFRKTPVAANMLRIEEINGNSIVWNQISTTEGNVNLVRETARTGTSSSDFLNNGHKYITFFSLSNCVNVSGDERLNVKIGDGTLSNNVVIANGRYYIAQTLSSKTRNGIYWFIGSGSPDGTACTIGDIEIYDMTAMGKDSMGADEFVAWMNTYYPGLHVHNPGAIKNLTTIGMKCTGLNQWDEEWQTGQWNDDGTFNPSGSRCCSKNMIRVIPGSTIMLYFGGDTGNGFLLIYGADGSFLRRIATAFGTTYTVPADCYYINFNAPAAYGLTYNHDICINISGPRNGEYEPYRADWVTPNIPSITGKLNGQGNSEELFTDGAKGVGNVCDLIRKNDCDVVMMMVNLGDLNWTKRTGVSESVKYFGAPLSSAKAQTTNILCAIYVPANAGDIYAGSVDKAIAIDGNSDCRIIDSAYTDAATFKAAMAGVYAVVELATPKHYVLDKPLNLMAESDPDGTQLMIPDQTGLSEPSSAPFQATFEYFVNALKGVVKVGTAKNILEAAKTAGVISAYTMTWNAATGEYDVTITA